MTQEKEKGGFTLVELMIVLVIIAFISGLGFEFLLKPAMGLNLDGTISDFIEFFQYVQGRNEIFATSTSNVYILRFANTTTGSHYYASYVGSTTGQVDKFYLLQNTTFTSPTTGVNLDLRFCYGYESDTFQTDPSPKLLCNDNNEKICDTTYTIIIKSSAFNIIKKLIINTSSTDYCVPKLTRQ